MDNKRQSMILFVISLATAIVAILVPIFTYREEINLNKYKISEIEIDRRIVWDKQTEIDINQSKCLQELKELTIRMDARAKD